MALTDILSFFPENSKNECTGLFKIPLKERSPYHLNKCVHGVSYTQYGDAASCLNPYNGESLLDQFHGKCDRYLAFFMLKNPDWIPLIMKRNTYWSSIVHAFAVKELEDGRILFADARGYTDSALQFFADFRFSKQTMEVLPWDGQKFYDSDLDVLRKNVEPFYNLIFAADVSKGQALPLLDSKIQSASIRAAEPYPSVKTPIKETTPDR